MKRWLCIAAIALLFTGHGRNTYAALSQDEFKSFFTITELTTDNWEQYLEIYEDEEIEEDAFGEATGEREVDEGVRLKDDIALWGDEIVMRFQVAYTEEWGNYDANGNKVSGEDPYETQDEVDVVITFRKGTIVYDILRESPNLDDESQTSRHTRDISSLECTKIKGSVMEGDIPESAWTEENGEKFIAVDDGEGSYYKLYDSGEIEHIFATGRLRSHTFIPRQDLSEAPVFVGWLEWSKETNLFSEDAVNSASTAYDELGEEAKAQITNYADLETAEATLDMSKEVASVLEGHTWYFNGGDDTILNSIGFTSGSATISQVSFDSNGKHDNGSNDYSYTVDTANILVALADGGNLEIPYERDGENVTIGNGEYFTIEEIEAAIQGCWNMRNSSIILGRRCVTDKSILFDNGKVTSESASLANGSTTGEYYYYGPYQGTYELNFGGVETDMEHGSEWFFNIIDGKVVILYYDHVCSPSDGLPGENGYSFK